VGIWGRGILLVAQNDDGYGFARSSVANGISDVERQVWGSWVHLASLAVWSLAMLLSVTGLGMVLFVAGWVPALIVLRKFRAKNFIAHHAREAVNFQISLLLVVAISVTVMLPLGILTLGLGFFAAPIVFGAIGLWGLVWQIVAFFQARSGKFFVYPLVPFRFVK